MNRYFSLRQQIDREISKIPKKNRPKFQADYLKLIQLAQKENYENYNLPGYSHILSLFTCHIYHSRFRAVIGL